MYAVYKLAQQQKVYIREECVAMNFSQPDVLALVSAEFLSNFDSEGAGACRE